MWSCYDRARQATAVDHPLPSEAPIPKALFACSGGGHLKQLDALAPRLGVAPEDQVWLTFDNALSRGLLKGRRVEFIPYVHPRDLRGAWRIRGIAKRLVREGGFDLAVSTGAIPGVASLPTFAAAGIPSHFIESAARANGPSLSGRIVAKFPRIATYSQYPSWADRRWQFRGSIYDAYRAKGSDRPSIRLKRAVVTVGTTEGFPFDRLFQRLAPLLADFEDVLWQTGDQDVSAWGIEGRATVPHDELQAAIRAADVVIAHCGTGSALTALEAGRLPVLVPRWSRFGEHIDDHQVQIGRELERRGLAVLREADEIDLADLALAASGSIEAVDPPRFELL